MGQKITQVNAFTDTPFTGNPAAVCVLPAPADETWMQTLAREINVSETAFPVTGSAHCCLGPYWKTRLRKDQMLARQISARGGVVRVRVEDSRVLLGGQAVTVWRGELGA